MKFPDYLKNNKLLNKLTHSKESLSPINNSLLLILIASSVNVYH